MVRKLSSTILICTLWISVSLAQNEIPQTGSSGTENQGNQESYEDALNAMQEQASASGTISSNIELWKAVNFGANLEETELDTALGFFHAYNPIFKRSISNTHTGNLGGAYLSNDFFSRKSSSDFYFFQSVDAYLRTPETIEYLNTTTPYTLLDYSQSENRNTRNETRFNVLHSQNVNKKFNFIFLYDQAKSTGHYQKQEAKFHNIALATSYISDKYISHFNVIFNRHNSQENGGLVSGQNLNEYGETESYLINMLNANSSISNNIVSLTNEYRIGKTEEKETTDGVIYEEFRPITGLIHQFEYSGNERNYSDLDPNLDFYPNTYIDSLATDDSAIYNRITNVFQLKFYESPERKFTFSKRAFIGNDIISIKLPGTIFLEKESHHNTYTGGAISRDEGKFWRWNIQGKLYLTGFRSGQTELSAFINKPLLIGKDTTSIYVEGELNSIVPDYFVQNFSSNHYQWSNNFYNTNEMIVRSKIQSQKYNFTLGLNYALISNYIFNNREALPQQGGNEMLVVSAYAKKDFESKHWLIRTHAIWQKSNRENYLHLPDFTGYLSFNYKTLWEKVMYTQIGFDVRYNTEFYADAYDSATGRFFWQDQQKIGNFPFIDLHVNLKLKRTRAFFQWLNAGSGLFDGNFWSAPNHPLYRRTFRLGIAWSFYD